MNLIFLSTTWYKNAHKSLNYGPIASKTNQFKILIVLTWSQNNTPMVSSFG